MQSTHNSGCLAEKPNLLLSSSLTMPPWGRIFSRRKTQTHSKREGADVTLWWELQEEIHTFSKRCFFAFVFFSSPKTIAGYQTKRKPENLLLLIACLLSVGFVLGFFFLFFLLFTRVLNGDCWCWQWNRNAQSGFFADISTHFNINLQSWVCRASWKYISDPSLLLSLSRWAN